MRIFDPFSYKATLTQRFVPVCAQEVFHLAAYFPIVWRYNHIGRLELSVMRCLAASDVEIPNVRALPYDALPYLLQAYPFRFRNHSMGDFTIGLERVFPKHERDIGAYVYDTMGTFGLGAQLKTNALDQFHQDSAVLVDLGEALLSRGRLEPVRLPHEIEQKFGIPEMFAIRDEPQWSDALDRVDEEKWPTLIRLLTAQRVSLYRAASLISAEERRA